ncbi:MAG: DUF4160 domain-containing protein [Chloroflexi bacterium]|nr:DUF4160 domain-containing protein [Chloroflexota bacterium]
MARVVSSGPFSIYVYAEAGQPHHLPHCHVRWSEGSTQVALPTLRVLAGDPLPAAARRLLLDHLEAICGAWERLNPGRPIA